jgi:putative Mn2+ efflux pump MntP
MAMNSVTALMPVFGEFIKQTLHNATYYKILLFIGSVCLLLFGSFFMAYSSAPNIESRMFL